MKTPIQLSFEPIAGQGALYHVKRLSCGMNGMKNKVKALEGYLVVRARAGDQKAMGDLIQLRGPRLMAHATRLIGEVEAAKDIVQDAWIEILRGIPQLRDANAFLPWALRIVSRRVARVISSRQKDRRLSVEVAKVSISETPEAGPMASDSAKARAAIDCLPPEQEATVALFYLEELSVSEVAMALDVPIGTIKTRLMHARKKLRAKLERKEHGKT